MTTVTWDELGAAALARQFPTESAHDGAAVVAMLSRLGPVQSQTARSPFLGLAARLPGVRLQAITEAYERFEIVRGSVIRGTVHTCAAAQHALLATATSLGQARLWRRALGVDDAALPTLWAGIEEFAYDEWRSPDDLTQHLDRWLKRTGHPGLPAGASSRYLGFGHGGLLRRPRAGAWQGQGAAEYRTAAALLGPAGVRTASLGDALAELFSTYLAAHGPASRHDLAWWSGLGLTRVDQVLEGLRLTSVTGPDGRAYVDQPGTTGTGRPPSVALLPEFDALLCAYSPAARARFVSPAHHDALWNNKNGLVLPPLLVDGRLTGYWRSTGSARRRPLEVTWFAGTRRPRRSELEEPVAAIEAALDLAVTEVTVSRQAA